MSRVFSGVQPSGNLHLGNYLGAMKNFVKLQEDHECIYCVVDMHAITVKLDPLTLKKNVLEVAAAFIASGINPDILVYYKVMGPDDNLQFNDIGWTSATIKSTVQPDATDFKEHTYEIESLEDFTSFSIKVVLQSVNSANVPFIENFRAIALST